MICDTCVKRQTNANVLTVIALHPCKLNIYFSQHLSDNLSAARLPHCHLHPDANDKIQRDQRQPQIYLHECALLF